MSDTSKIRRSRIDLGYHKRGDALGRWRGRLVLFALTAAGLWLLLAPSSGQGKGANLRLFQHASLASKGPLTRAHAAWDNQCEACHTPFQGINTSRWSPSLNRASTAGDQNCQTCHAGPAHHPNQIASEVPSCAECHRDHRGRDFRLAATPDAGCTGCHADLGRHRNPSANSAAIANVTAFDAEHHPAFTLPASLAGKHPGRIKFSHKRHLTPGLVLEQGGAPFTRANLAAADRTRYGGPAGREADPVQLTCASCHRLDDATDATPRFANQIPRLPGEAMLPVSYESSCRACHPLAFDRNAPTVEARHGQEPAALVEEINRFYKAQALEEKPDLLNRFVPPQPQPGRSAAELDTVRDRVEAKTLMAVRRFFGSAVSEADRQGAGLPLSRGGCVECHELSSTPGPLTSLAAARNLALEPVAIRSLWYENARFNHASHRAVECASCHAGVEQAADQSKPHMPGIESCTTCHAPAASPGGRSTGGAGFDCVECHRYHATDVAAHGLGSPLRKPVAALSIEQFLSGAPPARP